MEKPIKEIQFHALSIMSVLIDEYIYINIEQGVLRMIKLFFVDFSEGWIKGVLNS